MLKTSEVDYENLWKYTDEELKELPGNPNPTDVFASEDFSQYPSLFDTPTAKKAIKELGLKFHDWQEDGHRDFFRMNNGLPAIKTMATCINRQQGKSEKVADIMLFYLRFGLGDILYTSYRSTSAAEVHGRMFQKIQNATGLSAKILPISKQSRGRDRANMQITSYDPITMQVKNTATFMTRSSASARGLSRSLIIFDEAQAMSNEELSVIGPVNSTKENGQTVYIGTAPSLSGDAGLGVTGKSSTNSEVWRNLRSRAKNGTTTKTLWKEWSTKKIVGEGREKLEAIVLTNPSLNKEITPGTKQTMDNLLSNGMDTVSFHVEHLGLWLDSQSKNSAVNYALWSAGQIEEFPKMEKGAKITLAIKVDGKDSRIDIAQSIRMPNDENIYSQLLKSFDINSEEPWVDEAYDLIKPYLKASVCKSIVFDGKTGVFDILEKIANTRETARFWNINSSKKTQGKITETSFADVLMASSTLSTKVVERKILHTPSRDLDLAAKEAVKIPARNGGFRFGDGSHVSANPLEAVALATQAALKLKVRATSNDADQLDIKEDNNNENTVVQKGAIFGQKKSSGIFTQGGSIFS